VTPEDLEAIRGIIRETTAPHKPPSFLREWLPVIVTAGTLLAGGCVAANYLLVTESEAAIIHRELERAKDDDVAEVVNVVHDNATNLRLLDQRIEQNLERINDLRADYRRRHGRTRGDDE